jgi:subtilisin family serine protease
MKLGKRILVLSFFTLFLSAVAGTPKNPAFPTDIDSSSPAEHCVAVIDSGIDYLHADFKGSIFTNPREGPGGLKWGIDDDVNGYPGDLHGWDFIDNDPYPYDVRLRMIDNPFVRMVWGRAEDPTPEEEALLQFELLADEFLKIFVNVTSGHGTHVSGIAKKASGIPCILPIRAPVTVDGINKAIQYAASLGVRVVNMSFGLDLAPFADERARFHEIENLMLEHPEMLFVTVSHNQTKNLVAEKIELFPATAQIPNKLVVGAVDGLGALADFSNVGLGLVDIFSPGVDIQSTCLGGGQCAMSGTSMSAPFVAGLAAKLMKRFPKSSGVDLRNRILAMAKIQTLNFKKGDAEKELNFQAPVLLPAYIPKDLGKRSIFWRLSSSSRH